VRTGVAARDLEQPHVFGLGFLALPPLLGLFLAFLAIVPSCPALQPSLPIVCPWVSAVPCLFAYPLAYVLFVLAVGGTSDASVAGRMSCHLLLSLVGLGLSSRAAAGSWIPWVHGVAQQYGRFARSRRLPLVVRRAPTSFPAARPLRACPSD
jgi:hypothetical protein